MTQGFGFRKEGDLMLWIMDNPARGKVRKLKVQGSKLKINLKSTI